MSTASAPREESLLRLRQELLDEMGAAEEELERVRHRIECLESDQRLGARPEEEYAQLKGHHLPRLERRLVEAYGSLLKVEAKILEARRLER